MGTKFTKELKLILSSQRGVALMLIMTAILILMAIYSEFTFESKISRIKATNIMDRAQAKLLAESGLQLAVTRLRLYKEAYNKLQTNQAAKDSVPPQLLNQLWEVPFMFPIPVGKNATIAFKDTVKKFTDETLLDGSMKVTISNVSNRMNLNLLRTDMTKYDPNNRDSIDQYSQLDMSANAIQSNVSVDQTLFFLLKRLVDEKKEKDEAFEDKYASLNYQEMITNLKYYISDFGSMTVDPLAGEAESNFQRIPLTPKYGPLASSSELYAVPGWDDQLIELIQNEFSVYPSAQIDLNKLTANMLKILIPTMTEDDIKQFFEFRDDPQNPKFFNSIEDLKKYIVTDRRLVNEQMFTDRIALFTKKGISFGSNPNLFKVISEGSYNRSSYTLVAMVVLPKQETNNQNPNNPNNQNPNNPNNPNNQNNPNNNTNTTNPNNTTTPQNQNTQLMEPKIIEIQVN